MPLIRYARLVPDGYTLDGHTLPQPTPTRTVTAHQCHLLVITNCHLPLPGDGPAPGIARGNLHYCSFFVHCITSR